MCGQLAIIVGINNTLFYCDMGVEKETVAMQPTNNYLLSLPFGPGESPH